MNDRELMQMALTLVDVLETDKIIDKQEAETLRTALARHEENRPRVLIRPTSAEIKSLWNATRKPREFADLLLSKTEEKNR